MKFCPESLFGVIDKFEAAASFPQGSSLYALLRPGEQSILAVAIKFFH